MKASVITTSLLVLSLQVSAQFNLEFQTGYGQYSMKGLKDYQKSLQASYPPQAIITESFPAFWYYGVNAKWSYKELQIGMSVSFGSTGGRVYYNDFSGTISNQQMLKYTSVNSIIAKRWSFNDDKTIITFDPRIGIVFGDLRVEGTYHISGEPPIHSSFSVTYQSTNISLEPTVSIFHRFGFIGLTAFAGYHLDMAPSPFKQENGAFLTGNSGSEKYTMDLSGFRIGGGAGFYFKKSETSDFTRLYVAPGVGLDYGGFGLNFTLMATPHAGFFAGVGYNLAGVGTNAGVRLFATSDQAKVRPSIALMYGYNTVVAVKNYKDFNRTFYGTTLMLGADIRAVGTNYWAVGLGIPFRHAEVDQYIKTLKSGGVVFDRELLPVTISLGYRIGITQ